MIVALVSFWDEHPQDLTTMIRSLEGLADRAVFLDGRYDLYPDPRNQSPTEQYVAILQACRDTGIECVLEQPAGPYTGNEVEKRAWLFDLARVGTARTDWFLRIDPDETLTHHGDVRRQLNSTTLDVAEVTATGISASEHDRRRGVHRTWSHRALFRAIPGLTVQGSHWIYTDGDRELWGPSDYRSPALNLTQSVTITHHDRADLARTVRAANYYHVRDTTGVET